VSDPEFGARLKRHARSYNRRVARAIGPRHRARSPAPRQGPGARTAGEGAGTNEMLIELSGPIVGYRAWRVSGADLVALNGYRWPAGDTQAECRATAVPAHHAPQGDCHCGFYALHRLPVLPSDDHVLGAVLMWGRLEVHWDGVRASHVRPLALAQPASGLTRRVTHVARRYGVPIVPTHHLEAFAAEHGSLVPLAARPTSPKMLLEQVARAIRARDWDIGCCSPVDPDGALVPLLAELVARFPPPPEPRDATRWMQHLLIRAVHKRYQPLTDVGVVLARPRSLPWARVAPLGELARVTALVTVPAGTGDSRSWREHVNLVESALNHLLRSAAAIRDRELAEVATEAHVLVKPADRATRRIVLAAGMRPRTTVISEIAYAHRSGTASRLARRLAHEAVADVWDAPTGDDASESLAVRRCQQDGAQLILDELDDATVIGLLEHPVGSRFVETALERLGDKATAPALALLSRRAAPLATEACARASGPRAIPHLRRHLSDHRNAWHFSTSKYLRDLLGQELYTEVAEAALRIEPDPAHQVELCALLPVQSSTRRAADILHAAMTRRTARDGAQRAWNCASGHPEIVIGLPPELVVRGLMRDDMLDTTATLLIRQRPKTVTMEALLKYWRSGRMRTIDLYDLLVAGDVRLEPQRRASLHRVGLARSSPQVARRIAAVLVASAPDAEIRHICEKVATDEGMSKYLTLIGASLLTLRRPGGAENIRRLLRFPAAS